MKIAVPYENGEIVQHFGQTKTFKIYDVEGGKIVASEIRGTDGYEHCALAGFLKTAGIEVLICGGIGGGATAKLAAAGITFQAGVVGEADDAVTAFASGQKLGNASATCENDGSCHHHGHGHETDL